MKAPSIHGTWEQIYSLLNDIARWPNSNIERQASKRIQSLIRVNG
jgi:hypothetical protein